MGIVLLNYCFQLWQGLIHVKKMADLIRRAATEKGDVREMSSYGRAAHVQQRKLTLSEDMNT